MQHDWGKYINTKSEYWEKIQKIYQENDSIPKKVIVGRNLHHKFLRSWSRLDKEEIDNDEDNLVSLSNADHILVHYYLWKCSITPYKRAASMAWYFMSKNLIRFGITDETIENLIDNYRDELETAYKDYCKANSEIRKGKRPKNFDTYMKKGREALMKKARTPEAIAKKEETKRKYKERKHQERLNTTKKKVMRCIEFDEVHDIINWRSIEIRADISENNLEYKGLHFEYVYVIKSKWKETDFSVEIIRYLDNYHKKHFHWSFINGCDCCGNPDIKQENYIQLDTKPHRYFLDNKWHLCYNCWRVITELRKMSKEEFNTLNDSYKSLYGRFLIAKSKS